MTKSSILGRVMIKETKEAPLHSSHLTIADIKRWDEGDYTCEGTAKNGSTVKNYYQVYVNGRYRAFASSNLCL